MDHALESFFREQNWLRAVARSLVRDDAEAEDLVQETWLAALQNPPQDPAEPRRWLRVVIRRLAARRHSRRELALEEPDARAGREALPETVAARWESSMLLSDAIDGLPESERAVVLLRFQEEGSLEEVAETLGVSPRTVSERLRSARERLRIRLGDRDEESEVRVPGWLAALAPLVETDEWIAAVTPRLVRAAQVAGSSAGGLPVLSGLSKLLAVGFLALAAAWLLPRLRRDEPSPILAPPGPAQLADATDASELSSVDVPLERAAGPGDAAASSAPEEASKPPAEQLVGSVRVEFALTTEDGEPLRGYRLRLQLPAGAAAFQDASAALSLGGAAQVEAPRTPVAEDVVLLLEPDPRHPGPGTGVGRPRFRTRLQRDAVDATHTLRPHLVRGELVIEIPPAASSEDLVPRSVVVSRVLTDWPRPNGFVEDWSVTASAVVRRGRAAFRDLPIGTYEVEFQDGERRERGDAVEVRSDR